MSVKYVDVPGFGTVGLYKRRDSRALKITIDHNNEIRVSMPAWLPYRAAVEFVKSKQSWIEQHRRSPEILKDGSAIGKAHHLRFNSVVGPTKPTSRVSNQIVQINLPLAMLFTHPTAQAAARRGATVAMRHEAEALLPIRLKQLAAQHGFVYQSLQIKQLRSRWGSCTHRQNITLNLFLMQLPWPLIDYVILHELTHTKHLHHGKNFWDELEKSLPTAKALRKQLRTYHPQL